MGEAERGDEVSGVGEEVWGLEGLGPWCVLGCSSAVVVKGAFVRDFRGIGVCLGGAIG
jgi:hypothetical protein